MNSALLVALFALYLVGIAGVAVCGSIVGTADDLGSLEARLATSRVSEHSALLDDEELAPIPGRLERVS
jgi:hypothetical protein